MTSTNSFTEYQNGYASEYSKVFDSSRGTRGLPTDVDYIQFTLDRARASHHRSRSNDVGGTAELDCRKQSPSVREG